MWICTTHVKHSNDSSKLNYPNHKRLPFPPPHKEYLTSLDPAFVSLTCQDSSPPQTGSLEATNGLSGAVQRLTTIFRKNSSRLIGFTKKHPLSLITAILLSKRLFLISIGLIYRIPSFCPLLYRMLDANSPVS